LLYFTIPAYYNYENFNDEIQKKVSKDFKLNLKNIKGISYKFLPSPHFLIEECDLYFLNSPDEKLLKLKNLKINVYSKNLHKKEKIEFKNIYFSKVDLNLKFKDIKNFYKHLRYSITKPIFINNSNLFFRDKNDEIVSISKIKKLEYFFNLKNKDKKLNITGNLFGSNFDFLWERNYSNPQKSKSLLKFKNPQINISNKFDGKNSNFTIAQTNINFLKKNLNLNYKYNKENIEFFKNKNEIVSSNSSNIYGKINLIPFFFDLNLILSGLKIETVLNNIFLNLYKSKQIAHFNINGNLKINLNEINNRLFENLVLNLNFVDKKINLNESSLSLKKIGKISFSNPTFYEKNLKLFIKSKIKFDVDNPQELYKKFLIPRQNRVDLNKVFFEIEYNVDDGNFFLSNINFNKDTEQATNFYEINNFQQLNNLISKEFKKVTLD
tara:strand:- start:732 stop:2045 length:1314 start_codon:yes stop_codon:yes gene_type:complete